jgi:hypothetical protein
MRRWPQLLYLLLVLPLSAGCARRVVMRIQPVQTNLKSVSISGHVRWQGKMPARTLEITATPVPRSPGGPGPRTGTEYLEGRQGRPGRRSETAYDLLTLPLVQRVTTTETKRRFLGGVPTSRAQKKTVSVETYTVDHYVVRLQPPAGWSVSPSQHEVRKSTKSADFVLTKVTEHR